MSNTVYVVAFENPDMGGFDWFKHRSDALDRLTGFRDKTAQDFDERDHVYFFAWTTDLGIDTQREELTEELDENWDMFKKLAVVELVNGEVQVPASS